MKISSYGQLPTIDQNYVLIFRVSPSIQETEMLVLKISVPQLAFYHTLRRTARDIKNPDLCCA
jgi:hypothetical protein